VLYYTVKTLSYKFHYFTSLSLGHSLVQKTFIWMTRVQFPARSYIHSLRLSDLLLDPAGIYSLCDGLMWPEWVAAHLTSLTADAKSAWKLFYTLLFSGIVFLRLLQICTIFLVSYKTSSLNIRKHFFLRFSFARAYEDDQRRRLKIAF
jgi:hypothetical protein